MTAGNDSAADAKSVPGARAPGAALTRADRIRRLLRYTGVNLVSLAVDYAVFFSLLHALAMPVTASVLGYAVAFSLNYKMSRRFVFAGHGAHKSERRLFTEFMATGLLGVVLTATVTAAGIHLLGLAPTIAKTAAVLICFVVLYVIRSRLVFTRLD